MMFFAVWALESRDATRDAPWCEVMEFLKSPEVRALLNHGLQPIPNPP